MFCQIARNCPVNFFIMIIIYRALIVAEIIKIRHIVRTKRVMKPFKLQQEVDLVSYFLRSFSDLEVVIIVKTVFVYYPMTFCCGLG